MLVLIYITLLLSTCHCIFGQSDFTSAPSDVVSLVGGNATLQCSVGSFIPGDVLQWYKDDSDEYVSEGLTILPDFVQRAYIEGGSAAYNLGQYNLIISPLQATDNDHYRCTYRKRDSDIVVGTTPATLTVLYQPSCSQSPNPAEIGQQVDLTCALDNRDVGSDVVSRVQWNDQGNIISSHPTSTSTRRTLSGEDNHEEFVCEVVVTELPNVISSCTLVPLSINPSASIIPAGMYIIYKGQTVEFVCFPIAYPHVASIDWLINGKSIHDYGDIFGFELSSDRSSFTITVTTDGGTSILSYSVHCRVYDPKGYIGDSSSTTIIIEPYVMPTTPSPTTAPTMPVVAFVQTPLPNTTVTRGSTIVLECAVNYLGDGVMSWFNVQERVYFVVGLEVTLASDDIRSRYSIIGGSDAYNNGQYSLQIINAKDIDSGMYFCSYESSVTGRSFSSGYAQINVLEPTPVPHTTKTVVRTTEVPMPTYISITTEVPPPTGPIYFVQTPSDTNTTAGSVVVLDCTVNYLGTGEMKWFKVESGQYIMVGLQVSISASEDIQNRYSIVGGRDAYNRGQYSLQITDVKDTDSGMYFCSYSSLDSTSISSQIAKLLLLAALVCQQSPDHPLPSGAPVILTCMVDDAHERTSVAWKDDHGNQLTTADINTVAYTLVLQPTDNFRAFTCSVVTANDGDFVRTCSIIPLAIRPVVKIIEWSTEASGGMSVNFTCQAEAEPYVSRYEWLVDGKGLATFNETFEFNTDNGMGLLELVPVVNGEGESTYNITCTVYIPSGQSTTSNGVLLLVTDRGFTSLANTDDSTLTVVTLVVISMLGGIVCIVIVLLCYVLLCHNRRRKLSLARKISFNHNFVSGGRYGARQSVDTHHIDGFGSTADAIYASPLQIRNGKKGITEKKAEKTSRQSIYENSAGSDYRQNSISSEYMNFDHQQEAGHENEGVHPVGFPNYGYCPDSPTSLHFNITTLPTKPTVAPRPFPPKRLSSFEPLPDVCNSKQNDYFDLPLSTTLENKENHNAEDMRIDEPVDELIYSNEPVHRTQTISNQVYDDFDSDSFDSDSEDETHM